MSPARYTGQRAVLARMGKFLSSSWFVQGDEESNQSRRSLIVFNVLSNVSANLIGGNFFTGLLIVLQADDAFVGLITMLIFGANLLQLFSPFILERFEHRKPILIAVRVLIHLLNIVFIGLIPFLPVAAQTRLVFLGFTVFLVNALAAFSGPGLSVWHIAHIPSSVRVQYFSLVSMLNGIFVAVFNLLGSGVVDLLKQDGRELMGLTLLRVFALVLAVFDIIRLIAIKELPVQTPVKKINLRALLVLPWKQPAYLRSVLVVVLWSVVVNLPGSYYTVYLLRELSVDYSFIMLISTFNILVLLAFTFVWRKIFLAHHWLKPLSVGILLFAPHYVLLSFVTRDLIFLFPIAVIWSFLCTCGINLAFSSVAFINIPKENQTLYIGFYSTANFLAALTAAFIGRTFVTSLSGLRFTIWGVPFGEKQLLMMIVGVLMLGVGLGIRAIARANIKQGLEH
ncbi:MAG TPA: MFS transporter [Clostridiales bacterium]|nr:MFS transporter [Clostridiales bacterium]